MQFSTLGQATVTIIINSTKAVDPVDRWYYRWNRHMIIRFYNDYDEINGRCTGNATAAVYTKNRNYDTKIPENRNYRSPTSFQKQETGNKPVTIRYITFEFPGTEKESEKSPSEAEKEVEKEIFRMITCDSPCITFGVGNTSRTIGKFLNGKK